LQFSLVIFLFLNNDMSFPYFAGF